jgi:SAM-dependent methyltransferase
MLKMARHLHRQTGLTNLVMAGGVALNSVANGRIMRETPFEQVYIQPNAGDGGGALGAALYVWHALLGNPRRFVMEHAYYGESFHDRQVQRFLREQGVAYDYIEDDNDLVNRVVEGMTRGQVVGLARDRFEWGPRALGNRSILADPRRAEMKEIVNTKIKFREPFRPFAPVVTEEDAPRYFDLQQAAGQYPQRFMLMVAPVRPEREAEIPAVSHMGTGRLQTVRREWNPFYYDLVYRFGQATGTPVLLNTSFNLRSEPIVATPADAFNTFTKSDIDVLVLGHYLVSKSADGQLPKLFTSVATPKAPQVKELKLAAQAAEKTQGQLVSTALFPYLDRLICPVCRGQITSPNGVGEFLGCTQCGRRFTSENGIPLLYWPTEATDLDNVTDIVKSFYEENPFPGYEETDTAQRLIDKARRSIFAKLLDDQMPPDASILEVGCGTGQLSNFLATSGRTVFGADLCLNSLKLGRQFSLNNMLDTVHFVQMNLYKPIFPDDSFDFVLCNGALPAVQDPFGGFRSIGRLVKPGGYIVVGLYNKYGRLWNDLRRGIFSLTGDRFLFLDSYLSQLREDKRRAWFADQYKHPQEIKHTVDEVLGWFDQTGFEFVNGLPKVSPFARFSEFDALFAPNPRGTRLEHLLAQFKILLEGGPEGGFFVMIGQKKRDGR